MQFDVLPAPRFPADAEALERVAAAGFGQRRKMLRQSLKSLGVPTEPLLEAAGIEGTLRAEDHLARRFLRARPRLHRREIKYRG